MTLTLIISLLALLLTVSVLSRIYEVKISVDDDYEWIAFNNASVYFTLITQLNDDIYLETPVYIIEDGLPDPKTYTYSLLLDDIGEPHSLRLMHTDSNTLCIDWISVNGKSVTDDHLTYDCKSDQFYECQQITAYFSIQTITHLAGSDAHYGCNWNAIIQRGLLKAYNIEITLDTSHEDEFYNNIGLLLEGFVFNSYYTPYYNLSNDLGKIYDFYSYDRIELNVITYDITPIQSLIITTSSAETLCVKRVEISVINDQIMNIDKIFDDAQCVSYIGHNDTGCNVLTLDFRNDKSFIKTQLQCDIAQTSFNDIKANIPETTQYTLTMQVTEGTSDYIFYQMEGHTGGKTECFNTAGFQLPEGHSIHEYGHMKNIGNPKKFYLLHDRNDDICIESISIHNAKTNDSVYFKELMCSKFFYDENKKGRCNVITINFEKNIATNEVHNTCPFDSICEFGLYEQPYSSGMSGTQIAVIIFFVAIVLFVILSLIFGYKCLWCNCVYFILLNCWDPFVDKLWNPKFENKCFRCSNTTDMQHNLCCYCCGCNYCNPFSVHRRRMDRKNTNAIAMERRKRKRKGDEYDTEEADGFNLTTSHDKDNYDMNSMDNINLGDNIKIAGNGTQIINDEDDELGDIGVDFDDSDSTELQLKGNKNNYSHLNDVEDAPINMSMYDDNDDVGTAVVDQYDNPELR